MQTMDMLLAFPSLILGLILVAMLGPSVTNIIIAIAVTSIPSFARIARAPTIAIKEREFIDAGRSLGFSDARLMLRHVLPNIFRKSSSWARSGSPAPSARKPRWLSSPRREAADPHLGGMIREGFENILDSYWLVLAPSIAILVVVFALNILGDGLRDAIDPKLKGER